MSFIAGPYIWKWGNLALGVIEDAPRIEFQLNGEPITADAIGGGAIDSIYQGMTATIDFVFQEFNAAGVIAALKGGASNVLGRWDDLGCSINDKRSDVLWGAAFPGAACLSGVAGAGKHFLAFRAGIATGIPVSWLMGGRLRQVPIRFNLAPYGRVGAGTNVMGGSEVDQLTTPLHVFELIDDDPDATPTKNMAVSLAEYLALPYDATP